jgi:hypothetical protein
VKSTLDNKLHPAIDRKVAQLSQLNARGKRRPPSGSDKSDHSGGGQRHGGDDVDYEGVEPRGGRGGGGGNGLEDDDGEDDDALEADLVAQLRLNAELKARLRSLEAPGAC